MRILINLMLVSGCIFGTGCQSNPLDGGIPLEITPSQPSETVSPTQGDVQVTPSLSTPLDSPLQDLVEKTKEDLANRLKITTDVISLVEVMEVEWSDSSLDCPQPEMEYLQVITPGYRILLQAENQLYEYHSNRDTYFVYCENGVPPILPKP